MTTKESEIEKQTKPAAADRGFDADWTREVIGAAIEVHRILGSGFHERTYEAALVIELGLRGIQCRTQVPIELLYKGRPAGQARVDLMVEDSLVVELKTVEQMHEATTRQVLNYLHAVDRSVGLLINFNTAYLTDGVKRVVRS